MIIVIISQLRGKGMRYNDIMHSSHLQLIFQWKGATTMHDLSGERIDQYTLVQLIGRGAFGQVYKARKDGDHRFYALKILIPNPQRPYSLQDFILEIRMIHRLTHPN